MIPENQQMIAVRITNPLTISVGIFSTVPTYRKCTSTGIKNTIPTTNSTAAIREKNSSGL